MSLENILIILLVLSIIALSCFYMKMQKKYNAVIIRNKIFQHNINSTLVVLKITLVNLKEQNSSTDLPVLLEILDEAIEDLSKNVSNWDIKD